MTLLSLLYALTLLSAVAAGSAGAFYCALVGLNRLERAAVGDRATPRRSP